MNEQKARPSEAEMLDVMLGKPLTKPRENRGYTKTPMDLKRKRNRARDKRAKASRKYNRKK